MKAGLLTTVFFLIASTVRAEEFYVDPVAGDDQATGTEGDPWRTLTRALELVPGADDVVHLLPGVYGVASGENYPLPVRTGVRIVGRSGSEDTILEGGWFQGTGLEGLYRLDLSGVTLRGGQIGIEVFLYHTYTVHLELHDVLIEGMASHGILADAYNPEGGSAYLKANISELEVRGCQGSGVVLRIGTPKGVLRTRCPASPRSRCARRWT